MTKIILFWPGMLHPQNVFGLGTGEILLVAALALIFIGPEKLPQMARSLGKLVRQGRRALDDLKEDLDGH